MTALAREVTKFATLTGAEVAMIGWHWLTAGSIDNIEDAINANFDAELWTNVRGFHMDTCTITERELIELDPATGDVIGSRPLNLPANPAGSNAGFPLPPQVAMVMSIRTATPGRSGRGRFYIPGLGVTMVTAAGRIVTLSRDTYVDNFADYVLACQGETGAPQLGVWSRTNLAFYGATSVQAGNVWDTQRRRRSDLVEARYSVAV